MTIFSECGKNMNIDQQKERREFYESSSLWKFGLVILAVLFLSLLTANTEQASANSALDSMIEIRSDDGEYDSAEAQAMIDRLQRVDDRILQHTDSAGVSIILMDMPLTELPE